MDSLRFKGVEGGSQEQDRWGRVRMGRAMEGTSLGGVGGTCPGVCVRLC